MPTDYVTPIAISELICYTRLWWGRLKSTPGAQALADLAIFLGDIVPHTADTERLFSVLSWFDASRRNRMLSGTLLKMSLVRSHHLKTAEPRCAVMQHPPFTCLVMYTDLTYSF